MKVYHSLPFFIFCVIFFTSCSFHKRLYKKGFYVSSFSANKKTYKNVDKDTSGSFMGNVREVQKKESQPISLAKPSNTILANNSPKTGNYKLTPALKGYFLNSPYDTIVLKTGGKLIGTIIKIQPNKIIFKKDGSLLALDTTINRNEVKLIAYANGRRIYKSNPLAITGLTLGILDNPITLLYSIATLINAAHTKTGYGIILFPIILALLAFIFCIAAIMQIKKKQDTKGLALAVTGLIISVILLLALISVLIYISTFI